MISLLLSPSPVPLHVQQVLTDLLGVWRRLPELAYIGAHTDPKGMGSRLGRWHG